ncbi:MAG: endonuclease [Erythrobacter sp.]|nr:endonuclease [Erythrobacter sp.]
MLNLSQHPFFGRLRFMQFERYPCVYILASKPYGTLYIGVTSDLIARLWQHRNDTIAGHTSRYRIRRLVRYEMFGDMGSAIAREKQLKRWHRQWKINLIESENPDWHDLAVGLGLPPMAPRVRQDGP